jgi:hypothetical protein
MSNAIENCALMSRGSSQEPGAQPNSQLHLRPAWRRPSCQSMRQSGQVHVRITHKVDYTTETFIKPNVG